MRDYKLLAVLFFFLAVAACKKPNELKPEAPTITAKWDLVNDSTAYGSDIVNNHNYIGIAGDYFDFRTDGKVYTKEGGLYDTLDYFMVTDTNIVIAGFNYNNPCRINPFTLHNASIFTFGDAIPGGNNYRIVNLKK